MIERIKGGTGFSKKEFIILLLLFGSVWGFSEVVLGNIIHEIMLPLRAGLLTGIAMAIMGCCFKVTNTIIAIPIIAVIAAVSMQLGVPVLQCSPLCKANANLAVILHGTVLSGHMMLFKRLRKESKMLLGACGFSAAIVSSVMFYYGGMRLAPCNYLLSFNHAWGVLHFAVREGIVWALFSSIMLPLGYAAGDYLISKYMNLKRLSQRLLYTSLYAVIVICCSSIIITIAFTN